MLPSQFRITIYLWESSRLQIVNYFVNDRNSASEFALKMHHSKKANVKVYNHEGTLVEHHQVETNNSTYA